MDGAVYVRYFCILSPELFTVSKDKSIHILSVEEGRLVTRFPKAHRYAPPGVS